MLLLPLLLLLQTPDAHAVQVAEHERPDNVSVLLRGLESKDARVQRLAIRALGRLERPALRDAALPVLRSADPEARREAVAALAQMGAPFDFASLIATEKSGTVRATIYEAIGRAKPLTPGSERALVAGLRDEDIVARTGAARGLETLVRLNIKSTRPEGATLDSLRAAIRDNPVSRLRQFALLALNAAGDRDEPTLEAALHDEDPQVRRLAVIGLKRWIDDPQAMVRLEALRVAASCERAQGAVGDVSGHVALAAVDSLGALKCEAAAIEALADRGASWRIRSRALVSLAKVSPEAARARLPVFRGDSMWQVRVYAANAARLLNDEPTLKALAEDSNPNVAAVALTTVDQALRALGSDHSVLLLAAAARLKTEPQSTGMSTRLAQTVLRLSRGGRVTVRDERVSLLEILAERGDAESIESLRPLLADRDPSIAALVARLTSAMTGKTVEPKTTRYVPEPFPSEATLRSLLGARAVVTMEGLGAFTVHLLSEEAPATVATFVTLAEKRAYDGLTFHRVVPNFVLQGGSPGASEYAALTPQFMRDELGLVGNERGTLGVSTRGHDTGDGQIFVNLIDNWRLDHTYTVFARVVGGMDVVDRILEGDVIESIRIERATLPAGSRGTRFDR